jgi:hypothetical protein
MAKKEIKFNEGDLIFDRYKIFKKNTEGGFGTVYIAQDIRARNTTYGEENVAIKIINKYTIDRKTKKIIKKDKND